jgi:hypothetical protein
MQLFQWLCYIVFPEQSTVNNFWSFVDSSDNGIVHITTKLLFCSSVAEGLSILGCAAVFASISRHNKGPSCLNTGTLFLSKRQEVVYQRNQCHIPEDLNLPLWLHGLSMFCWPCIVYQYMIPICCTFHPFYSESRASTYFEHYLLILWRRYTNGTWYIACIINDQLMIKTCRASWFSINWMKSASCWFH